MFTALGIIYGMKAPVIQELAQARKLRQQQNQIGSK